MSTFALKILAAVLMVIDHIGYYFEGMPLVLRMVGRASYPLFLFCMVWGLHYTKNRKLYLLRLYLGSLFMTTLIYLVDTWMPTPGGYGNHNIFLSMFLVGLLVTALELFGQNSKRGALLLGGSFLAQVLYYGLPSLVPFARNLSGDLLTGVVPNLALNEYGFAFVALGVAMYFLRENRPMFTAMYILFCIYQFSAEMLPGGTPIQWLMIVALPLMLRYNGKKGPGMKYFFYVFYPAHTFLLFYLANFVL